MGANCGRAASEATAASRSATGRRTPVPLRIMPANWVIRSGGDGDAVDRRGEHRAGVRRDLTAEVSWQVEPAGVVDVDAGGYVRPIAAGEAEGPGRVRRSGEPVALVTGRGSGRAGLGLRRGRRARS